jgi:hypothetical protein
VTDVARQPVSEVADRVRRRENCPMVRIALLVACSMLGGCSFLLVKDPPRVPAGTDPAKVDCTSSSVIPGIDALGGAAAIAAAAGGVVLEHTSSDGEPKRFDLYFAGPLVVLGVIYFYAAAGGTDAVEACQKIKAKGDDPQTWQVTPIAPGPARPKQGDIEITP